MKKGRIVSYRETSLLVKLLEFHLKNNTIVNEIQVYNFTDIDNHFEDYDDSDSIYFLICDSKFDSLNYIKTIRENCNSPILLLADYEIKLKELREYVKVGSVALINIHSSISNIQNALEHLRYSQYYICDKIQSDLIDKILNFDIKTLEYKFNSTEQDIIKWSKMGLSIQETADRMELSSNTIAAYRSKILTKTNSKSMLDVISKLQWDQIDNFS